jgi:N-acetylneuraminic acid mutarotase
MRTGLIALVSALTSSLIACGNSPTDDATPAVASVTVVPPSANLVIGSSLQLTATAVNSKGAPLSGRVIAWSTDNPQILTVTSSGLVTAVSKGSANVYATCEGRTGSAAFVVSAVPGAPALAATSALTQSARTGAAVPISPSVLATDQFGNPAGGVAVTFAVALGGGTVTAGSTTTDASGIATVGSWVTGVIAGSNTLIAAATGRSPVTFTATTGGTWTAKTSMPTPRYGLSVGVINGLLYATGGYHDAPNGTLEVYDPIADRWTSGPPMPTARYGLSVGVLSGLLYAVGGAVGFGTVEAFNPATNSWTARATMPTQRQELGVGVVNGVLYAVGGLNLTTTVGNVEAYNPTTNTWIARAPLPTARRQLGVGVVDGILYAVGGWTPSTGDVGTVEAYDPSTNSWTTKASMPTRRAGLAVAVIGGTLYAVGGSAGQRTIEAYHPGSDSWTTETPMPTGRTFLSAGTINGLLYAVGGILTGTAGNSGASVVEVHRP